MAALTMDFVIYAVAAVAVGIGLGWLLQSAICRRRVAGVEDDWQTRLDDMTRERDRLTAENGTLRSRLEDQEAALHRHEMAASKAQTELESAREREKRLSRDIFTLRSEREETKDKMAKFQSTMTAVRKQHQDLQTEFMKSREFYKGELQKSFEKRKELQEKIENAQLEHESFSNLLQSSRSEHDSVNKMLAAAQKRLANLDAIENKLIRLEAENAQLTHDAQIAQQEIDVLRRDVVELEELKVQNRELAHCLESMETSRKQYENDAYRYRETAEQAEKKSETLALRLDEVEKNFAEIEQQQREALKEARDISAANDANGHGEAPQEMDNLQEIVGIGKVFERTLHDLGIYTYRQIASFGPSDVARVNAALKEFRGRMEQDDWIGQAKELLYKKYGEAEIV